MRIDPATGYRYYSAGQLAELNRILALKELGLSLEQVGAHARREDLGRRDPRHAGAKKAELERSLSEEAARLRHIESRLKQIEEQGALVDYDVVVKSARGAALPRGARDFSRARRRRWRCLRDVARKVTARVPARARELVVVAHSDFDDEDLDLEIGFGLKREISEACACRARASGDGRAARRRNAGDGRAQRPAL